MQIATLKKALPYLIKINLTPFIWGPHGIGKSQVIAQFCEENELEFIDIRLSTMEVGDLLGLASFERNKEGIEIATKFMEPNWLPKDPNSKGIILLDELTRARRDVLQACFQLVYDHKIHTYKLPTGWSIIAASNPNTDDYITTDVSDQAFMDRFCHIRLQPTVSEFLSYGKSQKFNVDVLNFIKDQPELLRAQTEEYNFDSIKPSNRRWEQISKLMEINTPIHLLQELAVGIVGSAATAAFLTSLNDQNKPFTAEEILNDYPKLIDKLDKLIHNKKGGRQDILNYTADNLIGYFEGKTPTLTAEQVANVLSFIKALPREIAYRFCREIYLHDSLREHMDKDKEIEELIAKAKRKEIKAEKEENDGSKKA
jgi:MoxR-like ATPase